MKTSKEWIEDVTTYLQDTNEQDIERVQLDAYKAGMLAAAQLVIPDNTILFFADFQKVLENAKERVQQKANNLTFQDICQ